MILLLISYFILNSGILCWYRMISCERLFGPHCTFIRIVDLSVDILCSKFSCWILLIFFSRHRTFDHIEDFTFDFLLMFVTSYNTFFKWQITNEYTVDFSDNIFSARYIFNGCDRLKSVEIFVLLWYHAQTTTSFIGHEDIISLFCLHSGFICWPINSFML